MPISSGVRILYLPLEQSLADAGPNNFLFSAARETYLNTSPQALGGIYALGDQVSGYLINPASFYNRIGSQSNHAIEFDLFITGLKPQSPINVVHTIVEFKTGSNGSLFIQLKGHFDPAPLEPRLGFYGAGGNFGSETTLPAHTGIYTRVAIITSGTNRKVYLNGSMTEYNVTNVPIPSSFDRFHILNDRSGVYIKNLAIWTGIGNYIYETYSGNNLIITGADTRMDNRTAILYSGNLPSNYIPSKSTNTLTFDLNSLVYDRNNFTKLVLTNNDWVEGVYNLNNGLNSGIIRII